MELMPTTASPSRAWGKLDRRGPPGVTPASLSLTGHCLDVAAVVQCMLHLPTWRRRLERLAGQQLCEIDVERCVVLAFLHDVGKAGVGFQAKAWDESDQAAWRHAHWCGRDQQGHTRIVAPLLGIAPEYEVLRDALGVDDIRRWGGPHDADQHSVVELWLAAISHHGEPIAFDEDMRTLASAPHPTWTSKVGSYSPLQALQELRQTAETLWPRAFDPDAPPLRPSQPLIHAFAGLVSLADWIGSDTRHFPFDLGPQDVDRWPDSVKAACSALRAMRIDIEDIRTDLHQRSPTFKDVFGFEPTAVQEATAEAPVTSPVVLEAETGSGKTEAALWRFKTLFEAGEVDALCFLLPTRVAATSISKRLDDFVRKLFPDEGRRPNTVLAVPGYLRANAVEGEWLAPFTVQWPDRDVGDPLFWAAENSKRYFAAAVAAATIDQFLLSTLQTKHAHLRGSVLLRSLVVVDEVHASDPYMRALLVKALRRHQAAGGHALLLSATLTTDLRDELLRTAPTPKMNAKGLGARRQTPNPTTPAHDYPLISAPGVSRTFGPILQHKPIQHSMQPWMRDPQAVARCAVEALQAGARVLVLRNTVRQAVATQQAIEELLGVDNPALFRCNAVVGLHHGRYALPDRRALDARVSELFGKDAAKARQAVLLCATQTVEISVDCDADFLITDLAPMDVLLQRLGRLHRHADRRGFRPLGYEAPRVVVLTPPDQDLSGLLSGGAGGLGIGKRSAYPDLLTLQATLNALNDHQRFPVLDIPSDNRDLVERCCGRPSLLQLAADLGGAWPAHLQDLQGQASAQGSAALYQCIDWAQPWREAVASELTTEAKTRLGLDSIEVELPSGTRSPFGHVLERLNIPAWMLPTLPDREDMGPPVVEEMVQDTQGLRFSVRGQDFAYTRWGLAPMERPSHLHSL
ncbi:CRISPR-associated helicase Cas3' [Ideonella dechloratans]|uniref:CRISPR-associated helicase Cas3 n=2 Tax=Ideonella dechloratans TaxID=36863 RepID=A0A643FDR0_IDEDE|nr:CRISPR-associated helicase Cas3' [Ideonella dechloratans]KAB0583215.1 CRISPR-associated helicase Cas3' [Ideonella dechloratans]